MLIVVAVIAILVAISIPTVKVALEKSKHAVDDANERAAIGLGNIKYLAEGSAAATGDWYYKVDDTTHQGELSKTEKIAIRKCTGTVTELSCPSDATTNTKLKVTITAAGVVSADWSDGT